MIWVGVRIEIMTSVNIGWRFSDQKIDSMFLCFCSVRDHRWHQNVVRIKKKTHIVYYSTDPQQHGFYLLHMIKKQNVVNSDSLRYQSLL